MNKFKVGVAAMLLAISGLASALDLNHGFKVMENGKPVLEMGVTYFGMTKAEHAQMLVVENKFLNATEAIAVQAAKLAAKNKNIVAEYSIALTGQMKDDAGNSTLFPPIMYDKLTLKDVNKIIRANNNYASSLTAASEMNAVKGKKPWGNK